MPLFDRVSEDRKEKLGKESRRNDIQQMVQPARSQTGDSLLRAFTPMCPSHYWVKINVQEGPCRHSEEARALRGIWVIPEFNKALEEGYRIVEITEVWHLDRWSNSIFVKYIHTFPNGQQGASGYKPGAVDQESREKFLRDYQVNKGIFLESHKIKSNPVKSQVCKLHFNSFWENFPLRYNLSQTTLISNPEESYNFSGKFKFNYFSFLNDRVVQWIYSNHCIVPPNKVNNVFTVAFTTANGCLKLYSFMEQLQDRVLYYVTGSLIYVMREGET